MKPVARVCEADPFAEPDRLKQIKMICFIGGQPNRAMALFEEGLDPGQVAHLLAVEAGFHPREKLPWPELMRNPNSYDFEPDWTLTDDA